MNQRKLLTAVFLFFFIASASAQDATDQTAPVAKAYLQQALDVMQQNALHKKEIDWKKLTDETLARAKNAQSTQDTYLAITYALAQLNESHSFLQLPDSLSADQKELFTPRFVRASPDKCQNVSHRLFPHPKK